jgi:5'-methylthioadenosine phosphorylase
MGRLAVILGSNGLGPEGESVADGAAKHGAFVLQRHDRDGAFTLPHRIDHVANLRAIAAEGCDRVLAVASVGSLKPALGVGSLVCPDDFIALQLGLSALDDPSAHRAPGFDRAWRQRVIDAWREAGAAELRDGGVYWQAIGPRFETPAEIRLMAAHADLVGMTVASECVVAGDLGVPYAAICVVDNLANGIGQGELSLAEVERQRAGNVARLRDALDAALPRLVDA